MKNRKLKLNNGNEIPQIGLGTWRIVGDKVEEVIRNAISIGYRHIDTALVYKNEKEIGNVLQKLFKEGVVKREELFITSKLWNTYHECPEKALQITLNDLQIDYLDLYIIHWPLNFKHGDDHEEIKDENNMIICDEFKPEEVWKKMETFVDDGLVKNIGFSNFGIHNITRIMQCARIKPTVCQFEMHPYLKQEELIECCIKNNIVVTSYSSLGSAATENGINLKEDKTLVEIAKKNKCSVAQVILSWIVQKNMVIIPKSTSYERQKENFTLVMLDQQDVDAINRIDIYFRYVDLVSFGPDRFK
ncbi:hypothetical protein BDAP_002730 [Binucleata daphniae]